MFGRSDNAASGYVMRRHPGDVDAEPKRVCCVQLSIGSRGRAGDLLPTGVSRGFVGVLAVSSAGI